MFSTFLVLLLFPQEQVQKQIENRVGPRNGFQIVESPKIQKRIQTKAKDPIKPTKRVRLHDESLEEIEQIRERIGIKLFDGPTSREFAHQLDQLNQGEDRVKRTIQDSPKTVKGRPAKGQQIEPLMRGTWENDSAIQPDESNRCKSDDSGSRGSSSVGNDRKPVFQEVIRAACIGNQLIDCHR